MQVEGRDLGRALAGGVPPLILVTGDETLLVEEACDQILAAARSSGFDSREVMFAESGFSWETLLEASQSMSLFASKQVIDLRLQSLRMDGPVPAQVLKLLATAPNPDTRVLIRAPQLKKEQRSAQWLKSIEQGGLVVTIRSIEAGAFQGWLGERLRKAGLKLEPDALDYLAGMLEGNPLAAVQEIERLKLLGLASPVNRDALAGVLEDASHHTGFAYVDALFAGEADRVVRILESLRQEGQSLFGPLHLLVAALRRAESGGWMPPAQQRAFAGFRKRAGPIPRLLAECALIDQQGKGQLLGDAWESLIAFSFNCCGRSMPRIADLKTWLLRA